MSTGLYKLVAILDRQIIHIRYVMEGHDVGGLNIWSYYPVEATLTWPNAPESAYQTVRAAIRAVFKCTDEIPLIEFNMQLTHELNAIFTADWLRRAIRYSDMANLISYEAAKTILTEEFIMSPLMNS